MRYWVMKVLCMANGTPGPYEGQYLEEFTPDAKIKGTFTEERDKAMRFASPEELLKTWKHSIGTRQDGRPDRPLTAFTIEVEVIGT